MKRKWIALVMSALCIVAALPSTAVFADGEKVVTLGADLTEDQKNAILRYFGVAGQNIKTLTITNQDERNHLGSYVPLEQIGTHTYSCALVCPTTSGGIQVKTANLSWVTSNMIASTLSTSGVVNCDVLAASPFEVSGTGALTGILMAYESASGESLDETKKEIATQEMITTTTIANTVGQVQATEIVNDTKMQVIQGNEITQNDIDIIVNEVAEEKNISLSDEDRELLGQLLEEIASQDYDYEEMKETLERVEENVNNTIEDAQVISTGEEEDQIDAEDAEVDVLQEEEDPSEDSDPEVSGEETPETLSQDSILMNTDESALGDSAIFDATDVSALEETEAPQSEAAAETEGFEIISSDEYTEDGADDQADTVIDGADVIDPSEDASADGTDVIDPSEDASIDGADVIDPAGDASVDGADVIDPAGDGAIDGADVIDPEGEDGLVTMNLEVLPLSDFVFAPVTSEATGYTVYPAGIQELTVSFERGDIVAGSGTASIYNAADSSLVETVNMSDSSKVAIEPLDEEERAELGWTEGYKAVIKLAEPLAQDKTYFVILSQDAFSTEDGIGTSEATPDSYAWMLQTAAYGFCVDQTAGISAGQSASAKIMMDGSNAGYACIENADDSMVSFDQTEFWATGNLTATFHQPGKITFQVGFYDDAGNLLYTIDYTVKVQ